MMLHEPLHHFDDQMQSMIDAGAKKVGVKADRRLSLALLFYTSCELTKRALARLGVSNFKPPAYDGIHQRSWPHLLPLLEEHGRPT